MAYTSFGTRKALGRRYGTDPALLLELERLRGQYALAPGREERAFREKGLSLQREELGWRQTEAKRDREAAAMSGMIGTAGNLLTGAAQFRALTMGAGEPFFGRTLTAGAKSIYEGGKGAVSGMFGGGTTAAPAVSGATASAVNPATVDLIMGEAGWAGPAAGGAPGAVSGAGGGATAGASALAVSPWVAAGAGVAIELLKDPTEEYVEKQIGTSAKHAVGIGSRMVQGGLVGSAIAPGIGTAIGAAAGGVVGAIEQIIGTVICTELHRQGLISDEIYEADSRFGKKQDYEVVTGYHAWGIPVARAMRRSRIVTAIVRPIATAWAEYAAYQEGVVDKKNLFGAALHKVGVPVCRFIGHSKMRYMEATNE